MTAILINDVIQKHIDEAVARAKLHPLELTGEDIEKLHPLTGKTQVSLADRPKGWEPKLPKEQVHIPFGYRAAISFELQPPPVGLCVHFSLSAGKPGRIPNEQAIMMVARAFGLVMQKDGRPRHMWLEEFEPDHHAVNIVEAVTWPPSGG